MSNEFGSFFALMFLLASISVAFAVIWFFIGRRKAKKRAQASSAWQAFANSAGLNFIPTNTGISEQVTGDYRDHQLTLTYIDDDTIITLSANNLPEVSNTSTHIDTPTTEQLLNSAAPPTMLDTLNGYFSATRSGTILTYRQPGRENDIDVLQTTVDFLCNLAETYPKIIHLGSTAIPMLASIATNPDHKLCQYATALLEEVAQKTRVEFFDPGEHHFCPHCWVYFGVNKIQLSQLDSITHHGCRSCGQNDEFTEWEGQIVVVLDHAMTEEQTKQNGTLKINWFMWLKLFDFDQVHIIRATDEDVERFAVQVGNDTDEIRKPHYRQMRCDISADCQLSHNTMRILQHTFGQVKSNKI